MTQKEEQFIEQMIATREFSYSINSIGLHALMCHRGCNGCIMYGRGEDDASLNCIRIRTEYLEDHPELTL